MSSRRFFLVTSLAATLASVTACGGGPAAPSAGASLAVRALDERTRQPITDDDTGITIQLAGTSTYTQRVRSGVATFLGIQPGTYRVTTSAEFGFHQFDVLSVMLEGSRSLELPLTPIDDATATEILVDGQGSIPKGGTIDVPARGGINLHVRGRWQSVTAPFSDTGAFHLRAYFDEIGDLNRSQTLTLRPADWERSLTGFVPCLGVVSAPNQCRSQASTLRVIIDRTVGSHTECHVVVGCFSVPDNVTVVSKALTWPVTFRLAPGCCTLD